MNYRDFVAILESRGFVLERQRGSHRIYKGQAGGRVRIVVVAFHGEGADIRLGTLASMIRQSGLPKKLFR